MNEFYNTRLNKIENEIKKVLPLNSDMEWLKLATGDKDVIIDPKAADNINKPCHELIFRGGKRWRPIVTLLTAEALGNNIDLALKLTPLVELIHNGTLLVDDIEDKAIERRGKPAVHLIYGDDVAINSGNHLYYTATTLIEESGFSESVKLQLYRSYCDNMRRLHFGQGLDIQWHNDLYKIPTVNEYIQMCKFKTGCLASMSAEIGGIIGEMDFLLIPEYRKIWESIGVAFQIMDDILNITTGNPGKHRGDDIVEGKKSLPIIIFSNSNNPEELLKNISKAKSKGINRGKKYVERAISILEKSGVIDESKKIAIELLNRSLKDLKKILPESEAQKNLVSIVERFLN